MLLVKFTGGKSDGDQACISVSSSNLALATDSDIDIGKECGLSCTYGQLLAFIVSYVSSTLRFSEGNSRGSPSPSVHGPGPILDPQAMDAVERENTERQKRW